MELTVSQIASLKAVGLDGYTITHLARWIETHRYDDESSDVMRNIHKALKDDPSLVDSHSWSEIERMGAQD